MTFGQKYNLDKVKRKMIFEKTVFYDIPVFDSWKNKKSLYPLCLLGYSDFYCCFEV